jgi:histidinol-phosphate aminotransferase
MLHAPRTLLQISAPYPSLVRRLAAAAGPAYSAPRRPEGALPLHMNENLLGVQGALPDPGPWLSPEALAAYPDGGDRLLIQAISERYGVADGRIFVHCGASGLLNQVFSSFANAGARALLPDPGWSLYHTLADASGIHRRGVPLRREPAGFGYDLGEALDAAWAHRPDLVVLTSPNNPTGSALRYADVLSLAAACPDSLVVVDEAYHGFAPPDPISEAALLAAVPNVVLLRSFSKAWALAGLRLGFAMAGPLGSALLRRQPLPFGAPAYAQALAAARLRDRGWLPAQRRACAGALAALRGGLAGCGAVTALDSAANFALLRCPGGSAAGLQAALLERGLAVKLLRGGALEDHLRVTLAPPPVMRRVAAEITAYVERSQL